MRVKAIDRHEKWFDIPNDPDKGRLLFREFRPIDYLELNSLVEKQSADGVFSPETIRLGEAILRHIVAWENILTEQGEPLLCTHANKLLLLHETELFIVLIALLNDFYAEARQIREDAQKN